MRPCAPILTLPCRPLPTSTVASDSRSTNLRATSRSGLVAFDRILRRRGLAPSPIASDLRQPHRTCRQSSPALGRRARLNVIRRPWWLARPGSLLARPCTGLRTSSKRPPSALRISLCAQPLIRLPKIADLLRIRRDQASDELFVRESGSCQEFDPSRQGGRDRFGSRRLTRPASVDVGSFASNCTLAPRLARAPAVAVGTFVRLAEKLARGWLALKTSRGGPGHTLLLPQTADFLLRNSGQLQPALFVQA